MKNDFAKLNLKFFIFIWALRDKKKNYLIILTKNISLIKKLVNKTLYLLLNKKIIAKI